MLRLTTTDFQRASAYAQATGESMELGRSPDGRAQIVVGDRTFGEGQRIGTLKGVSQEERRAVLSELHTAAKEYDKPTGRRAFAYVGRQPGEATPLLRPTQHTGGHGPYGTMTSGGHGAPGSSGPTTLTSGKGSSADRSNLPSAWQKDSIFMLKSHKSSEGGQPSVGRRESPAPREPVESRSYGSTTGKSVSWERGGDAIMRPVRNLTSVAVTTVSTHGGDLADRVSSRLADRYESIPDRPKPKSDEPTGPHGRTTPMSDRTMLLKPAEDRTRLTEVGLSIRHKASETLGSTEGGATKAAEFGISTGLSALVTLIENKVPIVGTITAAIKLGRLEHFESQISSLAGRAEQAYKDNPTPGSPDAEAARALKSLVGDALPLLKGVLGTQAVASLSPIPGTAFVATQIDSRAASMDQAFEGPLEKLRDLAQSGNPYAQEFFQKILDLSSAEIRGAGGITVMRDAFS